MLERTGTTLMTMDERTWARHANPWSVWTRVATLPVLLLAFWSFHWIGWWALAPVALALGWTWWNPRAFPPPRRTDNWGSKATFGERVWINRRNVPIPEHHVRAANILIMVSLAGLALCVAGLVIAHAWMVVTGGALVYLGKMWFCDRMVWLYQDMIDASPEYRSWLRPA